MKNKKTVLYFLAGVLIMFLFLQYAIVIKIPIVTESFTPGIREMYRPYVRETRILSEGFLGTSGNNVLTLLKKFDLY